jgi:hypothetical protein
MKWFLFFASLTLVVSCQTSEKATIKNSKLEADYYVSLEKNIRRLYALSLGTFVAHVEPLINGNEVWKVSGKDSVILYSRPLGEVDKDGYWILSYEFMTSLPNTPIYSSIKQIEQIERDSFRILYYECPKDLTLSEVLDDKYIKNSIVLAKLKLKDKQTIFVRESASHFVGKSDRYEDKEAGCLRQNIYELTHEHYDVSFSFFDKNNGRLINKKKRPNFMVRRNISTKALAKIALPKDS